MGEIAVREPVQKRSIEKKEKIVKAGLGLFCEKGFYATNTVEIAKAARVSTGTVYSYFKDKTDIFIASFEYFLDSHLKPLLDEVKSLPKPVDIQVFVDTCIDVFISLYLDSKHAVNELGRMQEANPEIMQHFAQYEDMILTALVNAFDNQNIAKKDMAEKVYLLYTLADVLGQEHAFGHHRTIDLEVLRSQVTTMIMYVFTEES